MSLFSSNRAAGLARLHEFLPRAGRSYAQERNYDSGPGNHTAVSCLSPWIRCRSITEEEVVRAVTAQHTLQEAEKFIQEVCWRTYWKGWLAQRPIVWQWYEAELEAARCDLEQNQGYQRAISGRTDFISFNTWAHELVETGYLHNHARMWFASIWIHTLKLPWVLGAAFFMKHLFDGDAASNTLSWRWVAGRQTLGKTYAARSENIQKFTRGRLGRGETFAPAEAPQDELPSHPRALDPSPRPVPPVGPSTGLLLTEDDVRSWELLEDRHALAACMAMMPTEAYTRHEIEPRVIQYRRNLLSDSLAEAGVADGEETCASGPGLEAVVVEWATDRDLETVLIAEPAVGLWSDQWPLIQKALEAAGVSVTVFRRPWDDAFYPHTRRGFFNLKKQIPAIVSHYA